MGITNFTYALLFCAVALMLYTKDVKNTPVADDPKPLVIFEDSVMYTMDVDKTSQVIQSQKAFIYNDSEELLNATVVVKDKSNKDVNTLSAKHIVKYDNKLFLNDSVHYESSNGITLKTQQLEYDIKKKIAQNVSEFNATKDNHIFRGESIYFDVANNNIKAKNTHFKIGLGKDGKVK